ncbi:hypothetical protein PGB90_007706 [Kerria lacca]
MDWIRITLACIFMTELLLAKDVTNMATTLKPLDSNNVLLQQKLTQTNNPSQQKFNKFNTAKISTNIVQPKRITIGRKSIWRTWCR